MKPKHLFMLVVLFGVIVFVWYWYFYRTESHRTSQCLIYAVFGRNLTDSARDENSVFTSIDPKSKQIKQVGPLHENLEYQAIDIDPQSGMYYTNATNDGTLYVFDPLNGNLTKGAKVAYVKSNSFAFHPKDGSLWAWPENRGIIKIDIHSGNATMRYESKKEIAALAWDSAGTKLYIADDESQVLYVYDPSAGTVMQVADNLMYETTGLATLSDNLLLGGKLDDDKDLLTLYIYDLKSMRSVSAIEMQSEEHGLEGLTWPIACGRPF